MAISVRYARTCARSVLKPVLRTPANTSTALNAKEHAKPVRYSAKSMLPSSTPDLPVGRLVTRLKTSSRRRDENASGSEQTGRINESPADGRRPLFIVMNAGSGRGNARTVREDLARLLHDAGQPYALLLCSRPRDLPAMTARAVEQAARFDGIVVAAGGDGTIRAVAQQVLAAGLPFGVLPQGTFNYFARDNGLPQEPLAAAKALLAGVQAGTGRQVQVGQLNDQVFLVNASLGLYPQLLEDREAFKQRYGRSRLVAKWAGLLTLLRRDTEVLLRLDHMGCQHARGTGVIRASTLFVGNNGLQLEQVGLPERQGLSGGQLAVLLLPPMNAMARLAIAWRGMIGRLGSAQEATHFPCRSVTVEPLTRGRLRPVKVAMDGESAWIRPPLVFRVAPRTLRLIVPPPNHNAA